ncbi:MAG: MGMT family protein [Anaerolineales bacterium]|nr:MGMT family protein [Anaerolineales bacterium]
MRFTSPPDRHHFEALVWELVRLIPPGKVSTYGQVAKIILAVLGRTGGNDRAWGARWVGGAMAACPPDVPWQRVINSQGMISLKKGPGYDRQKDLLLAEGVVFDVRDRVDLKRFAWEGPSQEWLQARTPTPSASSSG